MTVVKDSRIAVRLSSDQDALIRQAAEVEGTSITEFTVAATMSRAIDVLADRRMFATPPSATTVSQPRQRPPTVTSTRPGRR